MKISLFLFIFSFLTYSQTIQIDKYLSKWLKNQDAVLLFNYENGKILYEYHSYMYDEKFSIGSIFKIITTFAYIENKGNENKIYICNDSDNMFCWKKNGHGKVNLQKAFIKSCNRFFYSLDITPDKLYKTAKYLGINLPDISLNKLTVKEKKLIKAGNIHFIKANFYELSKLLTAIAGKGKGIDIRNKKKIYIKEIHIINKIRTLMDLTVKKGTASVVKHKKNFFGKTGTAKNKFGKLIGSFIGFTKNKKYAIIVRLNGNIGAAASKIADEVIFLYKKFNKGMK